MILSTFSSVMVSFSPIKRNFDVCGYTIETFHLLDIEIMYACVFMAPNIDVFIANFIEGRGF